MLSQSISRENPPWWYVLREPLNRELDINDLIKFGKLRFELLKNLKINEDSNDSSQKISFFDLINKFYIDIDKTLQNNEQIEIYFLGHWYLRICAACSSRIESWLVESEGDLFEEIFNFHSVEEQLQIFRLIAESERMVTVPKNIKNDIYLPNELDKSDYWAINWTLVPDLVSTKKGALYNGYLIGPALIFQKQVKKLFEKKLRKNITLLKKNSNFQAFIESNKILETSIKELEKNLLLAFKDSSHAYFYDSLEITGENISGNLDFYPPCMRYLIQDVKETGYIKHNYRFQLGLFLKKMGMDIDSQLHFWYDLAVDNVGLTFEQFNKRAGYLIRHIYGLEGSKTDYEVPKCKKIMTDYFCLFTHINPKELANILPKLYNFDAVKGTNKIDELIQLSVNHRANEACGKTFSILFNQNKRIFHPLQWTKAQIELKAKEESKTT